MIARIIRTSNYYSDNPPCDYVEKRGLWKSITILKSFPGFREFDKYVLSQQPGDIRNIVEREDRVSYERRNDIIWVRRFDTLKELLDFKKEVDDDIIISSCDIDGIDYTIEIYDDYRE